MTLGELAIGFEEHGIGEKIPVAILEGVYVYVAVGICRIGVGQLVDGSLFQDSNLGDRITIDAFKLGFLVIVVTGS